jgi:glycosyltransferase involved in cell wall biosynthesis
MATGTDGPRVVIAVLTYRRDELLHDLLTALVVQAATVTPPADVLVVDNDPGGSARDTVAIWQGQGVRYVNEQRPGIAAARNRALVEATDADALVFIDDDETPSSRWLASLVGAWQEWGCAAVAAPVLARFAGPVESWVSGSGVFDAPVRRTGELVRGAGAGNLLLDMAELNALGLTFDERLGLTGGEDTMFTHALVQAGREIRWVAEATATEHVPADRTTRGWVIRRAYRSASSWCRAEVAVLPSAAARGRRRADLAARALWHGTVAAGQFLGGVLRRDVARRARATCAVAAQAGVLSGLLGYVREEYARSTA